MTSESGPNFCTINCEKQGKAFIFQNGEDSSTVISGLTIKNCSITSSDDDAGGILCFSSSPKIENCLFKDIVGYVIYCSSTSNPTIKSCSFINNRGTGIRCSSSSPTIEDCIFKKNIDHKEKIGQEGNSTYYKVYEGSGVFCSNSSPYIGNCIIEDNERIAIEIVQDSSPHIIDCKIKNNSQGIYINASTPTIVKCTISHNISYFISGTYYYGGGVSFRDAGGYIDKCTIYENGADYGGGIAVYESKPEISNSLIFNNYASEAGGGLFIKYHFTGGPSANISFCTIVNNAVYVRSSSPYFTNCIIWGPVLNTSSIKAVIQFSNINGGYSGSGNIDINPQFEDMDNNDYTLKSNSPCIDSGTPLDINYDLNGIYRPQGSKYDIGAYEYDKFNNI
ncbi:MAG: hypothetical protein OMM_03461 [Candidatus Magnetoglobus multicellularis str. Araruama]|uniref:Right handed beta helix domain-containing protein n=1 Tax=Candidatus Magnetoglobus multicellularis str. Araruama TaxID=890399 RepID=A0A1V1P5R3_9BACT|nr:MAG: hypothetical protein OMM_03461 [Candidatus Magnetoglobus multicellularis str. Araruama]